MRVLKIYFKTLFILLLLANVRVYNVFLRLIYEKKKKKKKLRKKVFMRFSVI